MKLIECVPNFSNGRDRGVIDAIAAEIAGTPGAVLATRLALLTMCPRMHWIRSERLSPVAELRTRWHARAKLSTPPLVQRTCCKPVAHASQLTESNTLTEPSQ